MNIAILGGRFDPPHLGHYLIIRQVLEIRSDIDKLLLVPASQHQWKPTVAAGKNRLEMLRPFQTDKVEISDTEIVRGGISYSIDTIKEVKQKTGGNIFWIVGSDIVAEFTRWEKKEALIELATFLVFPRDPYHLPKKLPRGFKLISGKNLITTNLSSTILRERIAQGKPITHLVPKETEIYIQKNNLYR
ncbi:nicotinate (nicotinamide) nucleotide adenylyltransferase [Candidatus Microgenomates bacterium]|nr:nicotinate (nicotinamide) nucleotide adenylyltransferase [Candidatus Microgenomates bacterium]